MAKAIQSGGAQALTEDNNRTRIHLDSGVPNTWKVVSTHSLLLKLNLYMSVDYSFDDIWIMLCSEDPLDG